MSTNTHSKIQSASYLPNPLVQNTQKTVSLHQAVENAPILASLLVRLRQSQHCLELVLPIIPVALHQAIKPSKLEDQTWCLLVNNSASASKLRQLLPQMLHILQKNHTNIDEIRIKIRKS